MEENKNKSTTAQTDSDRNKTEEMHANSRQGQNFRDLSEIDQDEGNMNNGVLGGNFAEGPEVRDEEKER